MSVCPQPLTGHVTRTPVDPERAVQAKRIIEQEHRSLAAVLHGLLYSIREIRYLRGEPDFVLLGAMIDYVESFLERFHHPKADQYLFERLRARCPGASRLLDRLHGEHRDGVARLRELRRSLDRYKSVGAEEFPDFAKLAAAYAAFHWSHMSAEENEVLPLASRHLTPDDWALIDDAFQGHADPLLGGEQKEEYQSLFRRIVSLAPPPIGFGSRH
jgi:branched-chain amino acid transport system ATP-binding protein